MRNDETVQIDSPVVAPAATAAAVSHAHAAHEAAPPVQPHDPKKREKTFGEKLFNWITYGGVGLLGNETASLIVMRQIADKNAEKNIPAGRFRAQYEKFEGWFKKAESMPAYVKEGRLPYLLMATVGGMAMVLPIKWLEDNKGAIVRKFDRWRHGNSADTDPHMIAVHEEMDDAPHQSWGSLMKGRVITVASAIAADATFGWKNSLTANWFPNSKFRSLDDVAEQTGHGVLKMFGSSKAKNEKAFGMVEQGTWLLTLSASLTLLFYVTSKMFAQKGNPNKDAKAPRHESPVRKLLTDGINPDVNPDTEITADAPSAKISHAAYEQSLAPAQQAVQLS